MADVIGWWIRESRNIRVRLMIYSQARFVYWARDSPAIPRALDGVSHSLLLYLLSIKVLRKVAARHVPCHKAVAGT
jgi:hypothetical protein